MTMEILPLPLPGAFLVKPAVFQDERGAFVKTWQSDLFRKHDIAFEPKEEFHSISRQDVIRGMHFQIPPAAQAKLVYCVRGAVLDVILDLRQGSSSFGRCHAQELSEANQLGSFIPAGFAHGFLSLQGDSLMLYHLDREHDPDCDTGIRWDSFGFDWPCAEPILSRRDQLFPKLAEFNSPFA